VGADTLTMCEAVLKLHVFHGVVTQHIDRQFKINIIILFAGPRSGTDKRKRNLHKINN
jgi:hypothetical protein